MAKNLSRKVTIYINGKQAEASIVQIRDQITKLESIQKKLPIGSQEYIDKTKEIARLRKILHDQAVAVNDLGKNWKYTYDKLASVSNILMGIQSAFQMADATLGSVKDLAADAAALDDVYADVMKTTGLTRDQVLELNEAFKKMDTRTSREQLNQLAYEAGKLGINSKEAVEQFVSASDKINIALGDVLGEGAMVTIGKMAEVYAKSTQQLSDASGDLEKQMLAIGSAVNQLGQSSTANEAYMVEFLSRMGGIATQANLSADAILGFASALDQDMMKQEMSATAFQKFIMQMIKMPEKFAKSAQMSVSEFSQLMEKDMNEALLRVLEGFKGSGGLVALQPIFEDLGLDAARAASVISSMANSIDKVREAQAIANQELTTADSVIREFNTKNNNMAAQADKAKKSFQDMRIELGEKLYPVVIHFTTASTAALKGLSGYLNLWKENKAVAISLTAGILGLVAALARYRIVTIAGNVADAARNQLNKLSQASFLRKTAATAKATAAEEDARLAALKSRIAIEKETLARQSASNQTVIQAMATKTKNRIYSLEVAASLQAAEAERAHAAATHASRAAFMAMPWGIIITALTTIATLAFKIFQNSDSRKLSKAIQEAGRQAGEAEGKVRVLYERMKAAGEGTDIYRQALEQLKAEYPQIMAKHLNEEGQLRNLEKAYKDLAAAARQSAYDRMYEEKVSEAYAQESETLAKYLEKIQKEILRHSKKVPEAVKDAVIQSVNAQIEEMRQGKKSLEQTAQDVFSILSDNKMFMTLGGNSEFDTRDEVNIFIDEYLKPISKAAEDTERIISRFRKKLQPSQEDQQATYSALEDSKKRKAAIEEEISALKKRMELLSSRHTNSLDDQKQYQLMKDRLYDLEASARGTAYEIASIEKALSSMSVEQMKSRQAAVKQEIASIQSKLHVMESLAQVDFLTQKQIETDRARLDQLNREWETLSQAIQKAANTADNALNGSSSGSTTNSPSDKELKKWQTVEEQVKNIITSFSVKSKDGLDKLFFEINAQVASARKDIEEATGANRAQKDNLLSQLEQAADNLRRAKVDEYLKKVADQTQKLAQVSDNPKLQEVLNASRQLAEQIKSYDDQIFVLQQDLDQTDLTTAEREKIEQLIAAYQRLKQQISSTAYAGIDTSVSSSFALTGDRQKDAQQYASLTTQINRAREATEKLRDLATDQTTREEYEAQLTELQEQQDTLNQIYAGADQFAQKVANSKVLDSLISKLETFGQYALDIFSSINDILNNIGQRELNDAEQLKEQNLSNLDDQLERGAISQEKYEERKLKIEQDYDKKQKEIELEQWRREKLLNSSQAVMAGALAILRVWSDAGNGTTAMRAIQSAIVGIATAAQIAAIATQPAPYAKGGYVKEKTYMVGEAGSEWVASHRLLTDPATAPVIQALEDYQRGRIALRPINQPAVQSAAKSIADNRANAVDIALLKEFRQLAAYLSDPNNRRAVISRQSQLQFDSQENFLRTAAKLN